MFYESLSLICVALLWGGTNPVIKRNSKDIVKIKADSYLTPMALNQLGSILYFITLQHVDLTLSVPVANSLTFVFTALSGWILGEQLPKRNAILGIILILLGTSLCCMDKYVNRTVM
ncbi:hypothetical protein NQ314_019540 [Rhamnusium bicolor]|uniref:Transmembrane protein 234 n=1 Tax=Rhamnusium bicolor TaxID=1586634 RepID=A0AAV8WMA0_9CUCU|nr:hypothetical protein NQ314_019540 [Rhamnusium bicolor]